MRKESSTNFENERTLASFCNASKTLQLLSGRWKLSLLFSLLERGNQNFSDFKQLLPAISDRILALQLKQLADDALLSKEKNGSYTTYKLTEKGKALQEILEKLAAWQSH